MDNADLDRLTQQTVRDYQAANPGRTLDAAAVASIRTAIQEAPKNSLSARALNAAITVAEPAFVGLDGAAVGAAVKSGGGGVTGVFKSMAGRIAIPLSVGFGVYDGVQAYRAGDNVGVGKAAGSTAGVVGGALVGAAIGSSVPVVGTVVGGVVGGLIGYFGGGWLGRKTAEIVAPQPERAAAPERPQTQRPSRPGPTVAPQGPTPGTAPAATQQQDLYPTVPRGQLGQQFSPAAAAFAAAPAPAQETAPAQTPGTTPRQPVYRDNQY